MTDGIERVIAKAAGDSRFRERLLSDRERATRHAKLTDSERTILLGIPDEQLVAIVTNAPVRTAPRRGFLGQLAGWGAALFGGAATATTLSSCVSMGIRPDPPVTGSRPDIPEEDGKDGDPVDDDSEAAPTDEPPRKPEEEAPPGKDEKTSQEPRAEFIAGARYRVAPEKDDQ